MMPRVELPKLRCPFCGYEWIPRVPEPKKCPRCHNVIWRLELRELLDRGKAEAGGETEGETNETGRVS
jgi:uncharacterized OB-fold protein